MDRASALFALFGILFFGAVAVWVLHEPVPKSPRPRTRVVVPPQPQQPTPRVAKPLKPLPGFVVYAGAFGHASSADALVHDLLSHGFHAYRVAKDDLGYPYRVQVGGFASREQAANAADLMRHEFRLPTWVLAPDER